MTAEDLRNLLPDRIPEYGSDAVAGLPEPQTHITACERWVEGR